MAMVSFVAKVQPLEHALDFRDTKGPILLTCSLLSRTILAPLPLYYLQYDAVLPLTINYNHWPRAPHIFRLM